MESSKLNLVHTNRVELHNGIWHSVWQGEIITPLRQEKVRVYVMKVQNEDEPRLIPDGSINPT